MKIISIDVTKIDKEKLKPGKNGAKYLDLACFDNKDGPDKYGNDGFVCQGQSKEDREAGNRMPIIGNWKEIGGRKPAERQEPRRPAKTVDPDLDAEDLDIPF